MEPASPQTPPGSLLANAAADYAAGKVDAAAAAYRQVLATTPNHPVALHALGWIAHRAGDRAAALDLLRRAVAADPSDADTWNHLGIVCVADRRPADALNAYRQAVSLRPNFAAAHVNIGNAYRDTGRWPDAVEAYATAVRLDPNLAAAHHALGTALRESGRPGDAVASYRRALQLDPASAAEVYNDLGLTLARAGNARLAEEHLRQAIALKPIDLKPRRNLGRLLLRLGRAAEAAEVLAAVAGAAVATADVHHDLAVALAQTGRLEEAIEHFRRAVTLRPDDAEGYCNLGLALEDRGDTAGAAAAYGRARELKPQSAAIAYHHAALTGQTPPPVCPPKYLVPLFDGYADRFDEHLIKALHYVGPKLLHEAVAAVTDRCDLSVIDLGCGTGLCGELFRPIASKLVGVDLAPRMIEKSRQRGVYDELVRADIVDALRQRAGSADLVLAADVFIYVGQLTSVFDAVRDALRPGGLFAFTVESIDDAGGDFVLRPTRRYAHTAAYLRRLARAAQLVERYVKSATLRAGETADVAGNVFVFAKPS
jgi:predicted TPR repeat methyltransferase